MRQYNETRKSFFVHPRARIGFVVFIGLSLFYVASKMSETKRVIYRDYQSPVFNEGRILGSQASSYLKKKEMQLGKTAKKIMAENKVFEERLKDLGKTGGNKALAPRLQTSAISENKNLLIKKEDMESKKASEGNSGKFPKEADKSSKNFLKKSSL